MEKTIQRAIQVISLGFALVWFASESGAQVLHQGSKLKRVKEPAAIGGTFYSLTLNQPPLPVNPFPELPLYDLGDGKYVYDDSKIDYVALWKEQAAEAATLDGLGSEGGGAPLMLMSGWK